MLLLVFHYTRETLSLVREFSCLKGRMLGKTQCFKDARSWLKLNRIVLKLFHFPSFELVSSSAENKHCVLHLEEPGIAL